MTALDPLDPSPGLPADVDLAAACGSWQRGLADCRAVFHLRLGRSPVAGGYALVAGLEHALRSLQAWSFGDDVLARLAALHGADGQPRFPAGFLGYLAATPFGLDMDAVPEGTAVFPHAPLLRVEGPLAQARLVGAALREVIASRTLALTGTSGAAAPAQSALGATYELTGLQREGRWSWLLPPAERPADPGSPGRQQVRRFYRDGRAVADMIWNLEQGPAEGQEAALSGLEVGGARTMNFDFDDEFEDLLIPVLRDGRLHGRPATPDEARQRAARELATLDPALLSGAGAPFLVGLERGLHELDRRLRADAGSPS